MGWLTASRFDLRLLLHQGSASALDPGHCSASGILRADPACRTIAGPAPGCFLLFPETVTPTGCLASDLRPVMDSDFRRASVAADFFAARSWPFPGSTGPANSDFGQVRICS